MIYKTQVVLLLFLVWCLTVFSPVFADASNIIPSGSNINFAFSPNPVGSGARALGFGAFIAVADDATAASWNPGGLVQLKTAEISIVGDYSSQNTDYTFSETNGSQSTSLTNLNYLSFAYPFTLWNRNMVVSINYQQLYDFTREVSYQYQIPGLNPINLTPIDGFYLDYKGNYYQSGSLSAVGIAYGFEIIPRQLSVGITVNIWNDDLSENSWEQTQTGSSVGSYFGFIVDEYNYTTRHNFIFNGLNCNLGLLWRSRDRKFSLGAVYKSPFTADLKHEFNGQNTDYEATHLTTEEKLKMPMSYGIGAAYRFSDKFTISADIYRTHWENFLLKQEDGTKISAVTAKPEGESDVDPTCQVRLGAEYLLINKNKHYVIPLRMGLFYDPAPADKSPDDYYGFSLGMGFAKGKFIFDIAAQYRFGRDVGDSIFPNYSFSQDVDEFKICSSIIIHWD
ncbi:outer membrane protein transport protein [uncultured Desulfobacter sp.]|uniref:OmpP1/FadL family transporter n=1 Tax=uncultured Desulfobacter sp. TaxID=240139 RepID=UPI0029F526C2|nr:outer membrane protein transport protein [uncultured Desulfobacter sp.]